MSFKELIIYLKGLNHKLDSINKNIELSLTYRSMYKIDNRGGVGSKYKETPKYK